MSLTQLLDMKILDRNNIKSVPGRVGILYFAWHVNAKPIEGEADFRIWAKFAEQSYEELRTRSTISYLVGKQWMNRDLYLYVRIPFSTDMHPEEWLLKTSKCLTDEWQERFSSKLAGNGDASAVLHAGVSVMEQTTTDLNKHCWYDGMKHAMIHGQNAGSLERSLRRLTFNHLLLERLIYPVYQPIISLADNSCFGYESLTRCPDNPWFKSPLPLFTFAEEEGAVYALDRMAREKAIEGCSKLQDGQKMFINIMAHIMDDPQFSPGQTLLLLERHGLSPSNIVFEITERSSIDDFGAVSKILSHYRNQGYQIAIDDVGAGYSSLQSIVELRPDYIKVDRSLVSQIHQDEMKEHIMGTFVQIANKMGIGVIAEGIEELEELEKVREIGVHYAQGYLLGKPAREF